MSTEALIETILNHPIWTIYFVYDMGSVYDIYRDDIIVALKELELRKDADKLLLSRYQADSVAPMSMNNSENSGGSKSDFLEILLAQPVFYDGLDQSELATLDEEVAEKAEIRKTDEKAYVNTSPFYSVLIDEQQKTLSTTAFQIEPRVPYAYTPNGSAVAIYHRTGTVDNASTANSYFANMFPNATRLAGPTYNYNCHSFAWYNSTTSNTYWMDDPSKYWTDGSYKSYSPSGTVTANTRVLFKQSPGASKVNWHSVLVRSAASTSNFYKNVVAESKWSQYGLYRHKLLDHPYMRNTSYFNNWSNYTMTFYRR